MLTFCCFSDHSVLQKKSFVFWEVEIRIYITTNFSRKWADIEQRKTHVYVITPIFAKKKLQFFFSPLLRTIFCIIRSVFFILLLMCVFMHSLLHQHLNPPALKKNHQHSFPRPLNDRTNMIKPVWRRSWTFLSVLDWQTRSQNSHLNDFSPLQKFFREW